MKNHVLFFLIYIWDEKSNCFFCLMDYKIVGVDNYECDYVAHLFLGSFWAGLLWPTENT